jgi:protocatechuate 3,4-dioxygenase beta subunit
MAKKTRLSRREFGRRIGLTAAGLALVSPEVLFAGSVTPPQVEGPFYPESDLGDTDMNLTQVAGRSGSAEGEHIFVHGQVRDAAGAPLTNATVDIWQANAVGKYSHAEDPNPAPLDPNFQGWGIVQTDAEGYYRFKTIKPGAYSLSFLGGEGWRARHIHYKVSHSDHVPVTTQLYFPGDPLIEQDLEIVKAPEKDRWMLMSVLEEPHQSGLDIYRFDVVLEASKT